MRSGPADQESNRGPASQDIYAYVVHTQSSRLLGHELMSKAVFSHICIQSFLSIKKQI